MAMFKNTRRWLYALLKTVIGGACTAAVAEGALPNTITDWDDRWKLAASAAATHLIFYLMKSPLPEEGEDIKPPGPTEPPQ